MNTQITTRAGPELLQRWRRQVASQRRRRDERGPRPWGSIGYVTHGPIHTGLINVRHLIFLVLRDDRHADYSVATRLSGYGATAISSGVRVGGVEQHRFEKDLTLSPKHEARGKRCDLADRELLMLALELDRYLERRVCYPYWPRSRQARWPQLWAALEPQLAREVQAGNTPLSVRQQSVLGLTLLPLESIGHAWQQGTTVFADLRTVPKRQIVVLEDRAHNLCGVDGVIEFDLLNSRFAPGQVAAAT